MTKKLLLTFSLAACVALDASSNEIEKLEPIQVHDTAFQEQVKSITSDALENQQASDIKDILKFMPSVIVDGNARYSQKVYVRGLEDKSSNITIDGAKIGGQLFHHSGDQTIDAELLKVGSIELGAHSALSGAGVINGSFIYETKDPSDFLKEGEVFGGKIGLGYQSGYDRKSIAVSVFSKINDKLEFVGIGNITKDSELNMPDSKSIKSKQSKLESGLIKFVLKPNDQNTLKFTYNKYQDGGNRQISAEKPGDQETNNFFNQISRDTYSINYDYISNNDLINIKAKVYSSSQELFIDKMLDTDFWTDADNADEPSRDIINKNNGLDLRNTSLLNNHSLTYGISFDKSKQSMISYGNRTYTSGLKIGQTENIETINGGETKEYAAYIEDEIDLDNLIITLGVRYDIHKLGGAYSGTNKQLSPKFKADYQVNNKLKLRAAYGKIFKGPGLPESLMLYSGVPTQSGDSQPQTGHSYEVGFDYDLSNNLNADQSIFGLTAFTYNVDNYMHPTKNTGLESQSDIQIWGVESIFRYEKNKFSSSLSHSYTAGNAKSTTSNKKYEPLTANIHAFKLNTSYEVNDQLSLGYSAEFVPKNKFNEVDEGEVDRMTYSVHNISTTYNFQNNKNLKVNFGIDNLFDKKYTQHTAFGTYFGSEEYTSYEVGRNYKIKLTYKF